jgi:hypothetical protein
MNANITPTAAPEQMVDIEVQRDGLPVWYGRMTLAEFDAWTVYAERHPWLLTGLPYQAVCDMFLSHYRRGIDLNAPLSK